MPPCLDFAAWPWLLAHLLLPLRLLRLLVALEEEAQEEVVGRGLLVEATRARGWSHHRKRSLGRSSTGTRKRFRSNESI